MKVIIAEKPSVAKNIADALKATKRQDGYFESKDYYITWAFGHLLELWDSKDYDEKMTFWHMNNFPFIPDKFEYKIKLDYKTKKTDTGAKKQIACIKKLINDNNVDGVISACDYDREGQIIGDIILAYLKVKKPIYRILLNEWTEKEVLKGIQNMVPNKQLKPLQDAGISRQQADWLIGINLTSVATLKYKSQKGQLYNVGRVLLPTLKLIYDRDKEIEKFDPKPYYKLITDFDINNKKYQGTYNLDKKEKFETQDVLDELQKAIIGKEAFILDKEIVTKKEYPLPLFNLSALQGHVTSKYKGFTSDKVLKVAQSLYEKKHITYPRTASNVLDDSLVNKAKDVLNIVKKGKPYEQEISFHKSSRVFNSKKVESHSAIIPTYQVPKNLGSEEQIVYESIVNRFIMQFMPVAEHDETIITTKVKNTDGVFISKGRIQKVVGFKKVEQEQSKDVILPDIQKDEQGIVEKSEVTVNKTTPPKAYIEKTLLRAMETCGRQFKEDEDIDILSGFSIGTPATRADTIKKLCQTGYTVMQKKNIRCTQKGKLFIETLPVKELMDLEYTGKLEKNLADIEKGEISKDEFLNHIISFVENAVQEIKIQRTPPILLDDKQNLPPSKSANTIKTSNKEVIGKCPICQSEIVEGEKGFGCMGYRNGCKFVLWKQDDTFKKYNKKLTKTAVKSLLKKEQALVKGFTTPNKTKFDAIIKFHYNVQTNSVEWKFEKP